MTIPLWDDMCCWGDISYDDDDDDEYTPQNKHEGKTLYILSIIIY